MPSRLLRLAVIALPLLLLAPAAPQTYEPTGPPPPDLPGGGCRDGTASGGGRGAGLPGKVLCVARRVGRV